MSDQLPETTEATTPWSPPGYPAEAVAWLTGESTIVLDFAAGVGRLTSTLVELDREVYAVDQAEDALAKLRTALPDVPTAVAGTESIPLPDHSIEVVAWAESIEAQLADALPEIVRVLTPAGVLALAWNAPDQRIPWVRRLAAIIGIDPPPDPSEVLADSELFGEVGSTTFSHWYQLDGDSLTALAMSYDHIANADEDTQRRLLREVNDLYAEYERGIDGLRLPYVMHCFRANALIPEILPEDEAEEPPLIDFN